MSFSSRKATSRTQRVCQKMSSSYDSSHDEFDLEEEETFCMLLSWRTNKKPKIGGSVFGRQRLRRAQIEGRNKLMRMYFNDDVAFPESYFRHRFRMIINLFKHVAMEVAKYDTYFVRKRNFAEELGHST